jgi:hypothetical protein
MSGTFEEQLFKLANIYNYSITSYKEIVIKDDDELNEDLKTLLKNKILLLNKEEFNKILFTFYNENNNSIIPYIKGNIYINGNFRTNIYFTEETYIFLRNLIINNNFFLEGSDLSKHDGLYETRKRPSVDDPLRLLLSLTSKQFTPLKSFSFINP